MKRSKGIQSSLVAGALALGVFGAVGAVFTLPRTAEAQYAPPPAEIIATLTPVYHEGHATYWHNGYWHYRDAHGAWAYYHSEPAFLRDYRSHHAAEYHHYGRR